MKLFSVNWRMLLTNQVSNSRVVSQYFKKLFMLFRFIDYLSTGTTRFKISPKHTPIHNDQIYYSLGKGITSRYTEKCSCFRTSLSSFIIVSLHYPFIKCQRDWFHLHSLISSFLNTTFMDFHTVNTFDMWWGGEKHICHA